MARRPMRGSPSCRGPISLALFVLAMSCALVSAATAGRTATSGPNYPSSYEDRSYEEGSEGYRGDDSDPTPPRHPSDRDFYNNDEPGRGYDEQPPQHYRPPTPPPNPPPPPPAQCSGCPPGSGCVLCPIGYFSGGNASDTGANSTACEACPDFKTTLEPGATDISQCDYFKRGAPPPSSKRNPPHASKTRKALPRVHADAMASAPSSNTAGPHHENIDDASRRDYALHGGNMHIGHHSSPPFEDSPHPGPPHHRHYEEHEEQQYDADERQEYNSKGPAVGDFDDFVKEHPAHGGPAPAPPPPPPPASDCPFTGCPPGSQCLSCPPGTRGAGNSSDISLNTSPCEPCPEGSFTANPGSISCGECPPGQTTLGPGATFCVPTDCTVLGVPDQDYYLVPAATTPEALTYAGSFGPLPPVPVSRSNCFQEQTSAGAVFFIEPGEQQRVVEFTSCSPAQNSVQIYEVSSDCQVLTYKTCTIENKYCGVEQNSGIETRFDAAAGQAYLLLYMPRYDDSLTAAFSASLKLTDPSPSQAAMMTPN